MSDYHEYKSLKVRKTTHDALQRIAAIRALNGGSPTKFVDIVGVLVEDELDKEEAAFGTGYKKAK